MTSNSDAFKDKVAIVTGGGSGLGRALCRELATRGSICVVTDLNIEGAREVSEAINADGGRSCALKLDVTQQQEVTAAIDEAVSRYGGLDFMFNNAGIITLAEVRDMDPEHWRELIDVNLMGVIHGTTAAYSRMVSQGGGHVVNIASVGGLITLPTYTAYATTKHAVVALSNSLRAEGVGLGVKVTVVCPGMMDTGLGAAAKILGAKREDLENQGYSKRAMEPGVAARLILAGVARNKRMIVFPFSSRLLWWIYRVRPAFLAPFESKILATFRAVRTKD